MEQINKRKISAKRYENITFYVGEVVHMAAFDLYNFAKEGKLSEKRQAEWESRFGPKQTLITMAVTIAGLTNKLISMEIKLMDIEKRQQKTDDVEIKVREFTKGEIDLLERYRGKMKESGLSGEELLFFSDGEWVGEDKG